MAENSIIQSVQNSMVKHAQSLKVPKRLKESDDFLCEGFHLIQEALSSDLNVRFIFFTHEARTHSDGEKILEKAKRLKARAVQVAPKIISYLSETVSPQGMLAVVQKPAPRWPAPPFSVLLGAYQIQDPGNLGTLFRSAEAFGAQGIFLTGGCCDPFNPKVVRASMGSLFRLPFQVNENWETFFQWLKNENIKTVALTNHGGQNLFETPLPAPLAFWVGAEGSGFPEALTKSCDQKVLIPMEGMVESLNVGVAASLALFFTKFKSAP